MVCNKNFINKKIIKKPVLALSGEFSARQAQREVVKIKNLDKHLQPIVAARVKNLCL
jgi:hypothetical protein